SLTPCKRCHEQAKGDRPENQDKSDSDSYAPGHRPNQSALKAQASDKNENDDGDDICETFSNNDGRCPFHRYTMRLLQYGALEDLADFSGSDGQHKAGKKHQEAFKLWHPFHSQTRQVVLPFNETKQVV